MPYITKTDRARMEAGYKPTTAGELNYLISTLITEYIEVNGGNYQKMNDVLGALEGAKLEFYRRMAAPYEDLKIQENGDISGYEGDL